VLGQGDRVEGLAHLAAGAEALDRNAAGNGQQ
jgi:hypothetical protein